MPDEADPALCAKAVFVLLRPRAERGGVDLRLHGGGLEREVLCAPAALRQVLLDLCTERLDALAGRPGAVTVRITEPRRGWVRLVVDDAGTGRTAPPRAPAAVAATVARCGGTIALDVAEGGGRYTVDLPGGG